MLPVRKLRDLDVSAASGLHVQDPWIYVVADDELALVVYPRAGGPGRRVPLLPGELPREKRGRKLAKADFEVLVEVEPGILLAMGSGSRPNRMTGVYIELGPDGLPLATWPADLTPLYRQIHAALGEVNIEGAAVFGERIRLLHRGVSGGNAVVDVTADFSTVTSVHRVDLGALGGVPLSFTDAAPLADGRLIFSAAAEATRDPVEDAPVAGSALGILSADARVERLEPVAGTWKIEGIANATPGELYLVADADDPDIPAPLLAVPFTAR